MAILDLEARRRRAAAETAKPTAAGETAAAPVRPRRLPWRRGLLALAVIAGGVYGGWTLTRPVPVTTGTVTVGPAVDAVYASGVVEYVRQARVAPVITAPIRQVAVEEGQAVRPGQMLAQLDDGPQEGATLQLEALAGQARATAARQQRLHDAGFGAAAALEDARAQAASAEAAARGARARLADFRLTAPFAGRVLRRDAEPGDLAMVGQPMFVIADTRALRITADIDERDVGRLEVGQAAVVRSDSFPGRTFPARITEITPQGDSAGRIFRARLALAPDSVLRPGMTVEANLVTAERREAVLVPTAALSEGAVWVVQDGRARRRVIRTGVQGVERTEVTAGLKAGERVVLKPPAKLKEAARVDVGA